MAGHLRVKKCKIGKIWAKFIKPKFIFLPIKGGADFSAQNKAKTQGYAAKISAPKTVPRAIKTEPKSHQKPSENYVKTKLLCNRVCGCS